MLEKILNTFRRSKRSFNLLNIITIDSCLQPFHISSPRLIELLGCLVKCSFRLRLIFIDGFSVLVSNTFFFISIHQLFSDTLFPAAAKKFHNAQSGTNQRTCHNTNRAKEIGKQRNLTTYAKEESPASKSTCILSIPGWNFNNSRWTFKESATCESILNSPILPTAGLASENQRMMSLIVGLSLLKTHFGEAMQPTKPYAMISESFSVTTEITLNCRLSELKKQLYNHRDDLLVYIHDGSNSSRHQKTTNYGFLSDEAVKGSASRSIYIVLARKLTPEIRENCIPIIPAEICSTTDAASANWNDLISLTENNPDEFNLRTQRAYEEACSNFKGSDYCQDAAVLSVVSEIICWTFSRTDATHQRERKFQDTYKQTLEKYVQYWDSLADASALERFRDALYAAARKQSIRFRAIGNIDETYCKEMEVLYDEYKLYITLDLVKSLVSEYMSEFLVSDVLAQLSEAGILSDSIVKTLTLSTGHPKNVRLRSINRSFVNGHGRRDITTI